MKTIIIIVGLCLTFHLSKSQSNFAMTLRGGMPLKEKMQKYYSFIGCWEFTYWPSEENRISYTGLTFGLELFKMKKNEVLPLNVTNYIVNQYYSTGVQYNVVGGFYIGNDFGVNFLVYENKVPNTEDPYKIDIDVSLNPTMKYKIGRFVFFQQSIILLNNFNFSTINIGLSVIILEA